MTWTKAIGGQIELYAFPVGETRSPLGLMIKSLLTDVVMRN